MKKRRIFIIGLIVLLLACPSCMIYITVKQQDGYKKRVADNTNEYMLQFLTMAVESKTDPDYKFTDFYDEKFTESFKELIKNQEEFKKILIEQKMTIDEFIKIRCLFGASLLYNSFN